LTEVAGLVIRAQDMNAFLDSHPRVMRKLLILLSGRLRQAGQQLRNIVSRPVTVRVAAALLEFADRFGKPSPQGVLITSGQQELADMVGASREAVVKALRELRAQGLVTTARRQIVLCDLPKLRNIIGANSSFGTFT